MEEVILTSADDTELHRLRNKVDGMSGPGVDNRRDSITIRPIARRPQDQPPPEDPFFWALVSGYVYDVGSNQLTYSWTERGIEPHGFFSALPLPNGRSGTANSPTALYNVVDFYDGNQGASSAWIPPGSYVLIRIDTDSDGKASYRTEYRNRAHTVEVNSTIALVPGGYSGATLTNAYGSNFTFPPALTADAPCLIFNPRENVPGTWNIPIGGPPIPAVYAGMDSATQLPMMLIDVYYPTGFTGTFLTNDATPKTATVTAGEIITVV